MSRKPREVFKLSQVLTVSPYMSYDAMARPVPAVHTEGSHGEECGSATGTDQQCELSDLMEKVFSHAGDNAIIDVKQSGVVVRSYRPRRERSMLVDAVARVFYAGDDDDEPGENMIRTVVFGRIVTGGHVDFTSAKVNTNSIKYLVDYETFPSIPVSMKATCTSTASEGNKRVADRDHNARNSRVPLACTQYYADAEPKECAKSTPDIVTFLEMSVFGVGNLLKVFPSMSTVMFGSLLCVKGMRDSRGVK
ncbi:hypothetical protein BU17DRAFT_62319 [Hysterangium stoloniferum]|nr:hypothetical protein BU17DRAFT_62319 [Hysterangium stoloniferum]